MKLRFAGSCRACGVELPVGALAVYDKIAKNVTCIECSDRPGSTPPSSSDVLPIAPVVTLGGDESADAVEPPGPVQADVEVGVGGASARRKQERLQAKDDENVRAWEGRVRAKYPVMGGLVLAIADKPINPSTQAWEKGAHGEEVFANFLDKLGGTGPYFLHDRRIPSRKANIDHIVIAPSGVYVIDAKNYTGRILLDVKGGIFTRRVEKLLVGGRDRTKLADGVRWQVTEVRECLTQAGVGDDVPVRGMLCFIEGDWPLIGGSFAIDGIDVLWPKKIRKMITASGPITDDQLQVLHRQLAAGFPSA
jgi:hypothetical protein